MPCSQLVELRVGDRARQTSTRERPAADQLPCACLRLVRLRVRKSRPVVGLSLFSCQMNQ